MRYTSLKNNPLTVTLSAVQLYLITGGSAVYCKRIRTRRKRIDWRGVRSPTSPRSRGSVVILESPISKRFHNICKLLAIFELYLRMFSETKILHQSYLNKLMSRG
jgi:hypothetical protein